MTKVAPAHVNLVDLKNSLELLRMTCVDVVDGHYECVETGKATIKTVPRKACKNAERLTLWDARCRCPGIQVQTPVNGKTSSQLGVSMKTVLFS